MGTGQILSFLDANLEYPPSVVEDLRFETELGRFRKRLGMYSLFLALCLVFYHAEASVAQTLVTGKVSDENLFVQWEYDLQQGTGTVFITRRSIWWDGDPDEIWFGKSLLPQGARWVDGSLLRTVACSAPVNGFLFAAGIGNFGGTFVQFEMPTIPPGGKVAAVSRQLEYGQGTSAFGGVCNFTPKGSFDNFVTIEVIPDTNLLFDADGDGDVDLQDYSKFAEAMGGPTNLTNMKQSQDVNLNDTNINDTSLDSADDSSAE